MRSWAAVLVIVAGAVHGSSIARSLLKPSRLAVSRHGLAGVQARVPKLYRGVRCTAELAAKPLRKPAFQFIRNIDEAVLPEIYIRSNSFVHYIELNFTLSRAWEMMKEGTYERDEIKGCFMIDEEGVLWTDDVHFLPVDYYDHNDQILKDWVEKEFIPDRETGLTREEMFKLKNKGEITAYQACAKFEISKPKTYDRFMRFLDRLAVAYGSSWNSKSHDVY
ncbi:hypothetical protein AAMO2058_001015900 [Amorphochlora amoebiformis]